MIEAYELDGRPVEEEFYALQNGERVPYHGPMGTTFQNNWRLVYEHSLGATDGRLDERKLAGFEAQRQAQARAQAASSARADDRSSSFSQYIRGVESVEDRYWGESEQSYHYEYHWTDGSGNYRHSNDAGFNPNIGSRVNWQLMEPAG